MESYPMMLNLQGKEAIVVGGGKVAYRKIASLLKSGAKVTVISPELHPDVVDLLELEDITWLQKEFEASDLVSSALLVIAATHSRSINKHVAHSASSHQLVNVVDDPLLSSFHVPAKLSRGKLTIAVATEGASPALAVQIRDELAIKYDESYTSYLNFLALAREKVQQTILDKTLSQQLLRELASKSYHRSITKQAEFLEGMNGHG